ncbi:MULTISPECIES: hypothetical protein [Roseateles]|uniref:Uncharacterized protein n=1 Tax=Pelomonas aquatica TaxID=431058 RepID=A0ABU1Z5I4_9BURK|nr:MULTISPECIES: hypothetical protein [Roseateles]KQY88466.1 hypothetical protein ASD35_12945 [Pelomonas sp. Root1444]MDR7295886.1 hypothetical protein [Pelomonas aquatica]
MDYRTLLLAPLAALVLSVSATTPLRLPSGWLEHNTFLFSEATLSASKGYEIGIDPASDAAGSPSLTVRFVTPTKPWVVDMGAAHQLLSGYAGQRLRLSGQLRADAVKGWAGLFLGRGAWGQLDRIVAAGPGAEALLPAGTAVAPDGDWHEVSVVFDVPADAAQTILGLALVGEGQVWARNLQFQVVGAEVPTTPTTIGVDLQSARRADAEHMAQMAKKPPSPLLNAALD